MKKKKLKFTKNKRCVLHNSRYACSALLSQHMHSACWCLSQDCCGNRLRGNSTRPKKWRVQCTAVLDFVGNYNAYFRFTNLATAQHTCHANAPFESVALKQLCWNNCFRNKHSALCKYGQTNIDYPTYRTVQFGASSSQHKEKPIRLVQVFEWELIPFEWDLTRVVRCVLVRKVCTCSRGGSHIVEMLTMSMLSKSMFLLPWVVSSLMKTVSCVW